ncbi:MAG TPA: STAS domain-containing protein [Rhodocyclaceae bacterium]|jgi:anti-anti-sigma factor|nr:STAS domain-containing protein [Rhodocyclaceae bacterium]
MQVTTMVADGVATLGLQGRFDFNAHRDFRAATESILSDASVESLKVDLAKVDYLDSSALGMLLMLRDKTKASNRRVSLINCHGPVRQVLEIANFAKLFEVS